MPPEKGATSDAPQAKDLKWSLSASYGLSLSKESPSISTRRPFERNTESGTAAKKEYRATLRGPSTDSRRKHSPGNCSRKDEKSETGSSSNRLSIDTLVGSWVSLGLPLGESMPWTPKGNPSFVSL